MRMINGSLNSTQEAQQCQFLTFNATKIDQVKGIYMIAASIDAILILPTIILNILLIISLYTSKEIQKPSTKLLFSLAMSDVLVGFIIEPVYLMKKIAEFNHDFHLYCITGMMTYIAGAGLSAVSFLTLTAIAIDRYLVVHSGKIYSSTVTNKRVIGVVIIIWIIVGILSTAQLYSTRNAHAMLEAIIMAVCTLLTSLCYIQCFITLKKHQRISSKMFDNNGQSNFSSRYKKSIRTMFYVFVAFILCYVPFTCTAVTQGIVGESSALWAAESLSSIIVYTNSLVNPLLLLWRIKNVRAAFSKTLSTSATKTNTVENGRENSAYVVSRV